MGRGPPSKRANIIVARIIPLVLLALLAYASWVVTRLVCVDYLLHPPRLSVPGVSLPPSSRRAGTAIIILVLYYLFLLIVVASFARLIQVILTNPGYLPRGPQWRPKDAADKPNSLKHHQKRRHKHRTFAEKTANLPASPGHSPPSSRSGNSSVSLAGIEAGTAAQPRPEDFWHKDIFICNYDGRPSFCNTCSNFKTDRTHHCREVNRCVRKMDHFCPWVGGIVSETSFKFFLQFLFYSALYCTHTLVVMAYFVAERRKDPDWLDVNWILILAFAAMFWLFTFGMFASSFQLALINSTTVENLSRRTRIWYLAVYLPRPDETLQKLNRVDGHSQPKDIRTITYPRPPEEQQFLVERDRPDTTDHVQQSAQPTNPAPWSGMAAQSTPARTFLIHEMKPGDNPWDLGPLANLKEVFGCRLVDWLLPLRASPCADHSSQESIFRLGPVVHKRLVQSGVIEDENEKIDPVHRKRRKGRRIVKNPP